MESFEEYKSKYSRHVNKKRLFIIICVILTVVAIIIEIGTGKYEVSVATSLQLFIDKILGTEITDEKTLYIQGIVWDRLPRALGGMAVGAILGVCGCAMQSSMKNPLADPYTTGISSGASLGAALIIIAGISITGASYMMATVLNAFIFALIPAGVMIFFTVVRRNLSTNGVILIGIAVMFFFNAITTLLKYYATDSSLTEIYYWSVGTITKLDWDSYYLMIFAAIVCIIAVQYFARQLNVLTLNDANAQTLGINPRMTRTYLLALVSLFTAAAVCYTGTIGFIGLVAPHVCRMFLGSNNKYLIPASAASGAMILLLADCLAKNVTMAGLPVGVITSLIGGPVFLLLLIKQRKSIW